MHKISQFLDGRTYPSYGVSLVQNYIFRLQEATILGDLTEVPVPTRFLFVLLGPFVSFYISIIILYRAVRFFCLYLQISRTTELIEFFILRKLNKLYALLFFRFTLQSFFLQFPTLSNKEPLDATAQSLVLFQPNICHTIYLSISCFCIQFLI